MKFGGKPLLLPNQKEVKGMIDGFVRWPEDLVHKYQQAGYWEGHLLGDILENAMKKFPDRIAISFEGKPITYGELGNKVNRLALHLLDMGHKPSDRLILQLPNVPETIYLYFAAVKIGVIPVMTLPAHRSGRDQLLRRVCKRNLLRHTKGIPGF